MENALSQKLRFKPGQRVLVIKAPNNVSFSFEFDQKPQGIYDLALLFVNHSEDLKSELPDLVAHLKPESIFWICYPKKSSGISSDLNMMAPWDELKKYDLEGVAAAAIDANWTALRFRPQNQVKPSASSNSQLENTELGKYINLQTRSILITPELNQALAPHPEALNFFESLSFTNKKEYLVWLLSAKQEKTQQERLQKCVDKLLLRKKNPSEK